MKDDSRTPTRVMRSVFCVARLAPKESTNINADTMHQSVTTRRLSANSILSFVSFACIALTLFPSSSSSSAAAAAASGKSGSRFDFDEFSDRGVMAEPTLGGVHESVPADNSLEEVDLLGRFAVDQHNHKENALLEFARVVKAREQVVAGTLHHLTIETIDAGQKKLFDAIVWIKPWMNFKELQQFKPAGEVPSITPSDLGVRSGGHPAGWQEVPVHDPEVQDAAQHAVKTIQSRSNSLFPYELQEIVDAKAEVAESIAKFNMLLKVKRGDKEEKFKVEVHKNHEGALQLNQMLPV